ncbi:cysteine-rich PDZ-binding protein-like, partial [Nycticebus coucang]|uniref:cysteine-rich PDZ-binding protein-like n=1 Tax=Nycticebus coucang TaxID=9470 RepID=UPI00234D2947
CFQAFVASAGSAEEWCAKKHEKKLGTVITPDTWKDGARNTTESGGRKLNENKALTSKKARFDPYGKNKFSGGACGSFSTCKICKTSVHQPGSHYCQGCAYKKAICSMCGKKVLDTKNFKQTSV